MKDSPCRTTQSVHGLKMFGLLALITLCLLAVTPAPQTVAAEQPPVAAEQPQLVQVVQSEKSFAETLKSFREEVGKAGWSVLNSHNMAGVLSERGFTLHPVVILDV